MTEEEWAKSNLNAHNPNAVGCFSPKDEKWLTSNLNAENPNAIKSQISFAE